MRRFVGYVRVSDTRGRSGDSFISPDVQRERIAGWAKLRGVDVVDYFVDLDVSGGVLSRPGLDDAMRLIESREADGIVVAKLDRFSRAGVADALKLIESIEELGGQVASVEEGVDPTTPFGEFARTIFLALARMQRQQIAENWRVAQSRAVARGIHIASIAPTGYEKGEDGRLVPSKSAPVIAEVFRRKAAGASWAELSDYMREQGVVSPYGQTGWTNRAVHGIVTNRVYLGEARGGEFVNPDAHEPIIDRATWEAAQDRKLDSVPRGRDPEGTLLAGLLRCSGCRYVLKPDKMTLASGPNKGDRVRIYRCRGHHAAGTCTARTAVLGSVIEPYIVERFLNTYHDLYGEAVSGDDLIAAEAALADAESELSAYLANTDLISIVGQDRFNEGAQARIEAVHVATRALRDLRPVSSEPVDIRAEWEQATTSQRRKLLSSAIGAVVLLGGRGKPIDERAVIIPAGDVPSDFPRRGQIVPLAAYQP